MEKVVSGAAVTVQDIQSQIKPLSKNAFAAFFQRIWRGWLSWWYGKSSKYPRVTKLLYQLLFFILFSQGVTLFQFVLFLFLPHLFGQGLAETAWFFPSAIELGRVVHTPPSGATWTEWTQVFNFYLLGKPLSYSADGSGAIIIGGGLGYFYSFLIATFLAQCINFPLQRNITFKSHGNPYWQAMWYFIGWILIQPFCDMLGSLWKPLAMGVLGFTLPSILVLILDTIVMGGVAMAIFFFVFLIIFPDYNTVEKRTRAKLEKLKAGGADPAKISKVEAELKDVAFKARLSNTEKEFSKATTQASAKAMSYFAVVKRAETAKPEELAALEEKKVASFQKAVEAIEAKKAADIAYKSALAESGK